MLIGTRELPSRGCGPGVRGPDGNSTVAHAKSSEFREESSSFKEWTEPLMSVVPLKLYRLVPTNTAPDEVAGEGGSFLHEAFLKSKSHVSEGWSS